MEHRGVPPSLPVIPKPELIRDVKEAAAAAMKIAMFKENLFPSNDDLARLAETAIGDTIASYSNNASNSTSSCYTFTRY